MTTILTTLGVLGIAVVGLFVWTIIRRRVRVLVHRAGFVGSDVANQFFITVTNLSLIRKVEITHVWFDLPETIHVVPKERPLPKRLEADETWSTWLSIAALPPGLTDAAVYKLARVRLSTGKVFRSQQNKHVPEYGFVPGGEMPTAPIRSSMRTELRDATASPVTNREQRPEVLVRSQSSDSMVSPPPESKHPTAFVSHSSKDRDFVERFATDLRTNGVNAWYSAWEIKPGDSIRAKIDEGLAGCEYFIIILSKESVSRPWVKKELDSATVEGIAGRVRKIIPVRIEECGELPPTLASLCWEDFSTQPYDRGLERVLDSIFDRDVKPALGRPRSEKTSNSAPSEQPYTLHLRRYNRTVSMLGDANIEQTIREELATRFPEADFPVNIDVYGGHDRTWATVRVFNEEADINETGKAIPEDFLGSGGLAAAIGAAIDKIMSGLLASGKISRVK